MFDLKGFKQCLNLRRYQEEAYDLSCIKMRFKRQSKLFFYAVRFKQNLGFGETSFSNTIFTIEDNSTFLTTSSKYYEGISEEDFIRILLQKKKDLDLETCDDFKMLEGFRVLEINSLYLKRDNRYREKLLDLL